LKIALNIGPQETEFFDRLFENCEGLIEIRPISGRRDFFPPSQHDRMVGHLEAWKHTNLFFGVATRDGAGGKKQNIINIPAVWCDVDFKDTPLEMLKEKLSKFPYRSSFAVLSGGGCHLYWKLSEPLENKDMAVVEDANRRITYFFNADFNACDASRVLRIPGSLNYKPEYGKPRRVKIAHMANFRYEINDFIELEQAPQALPPKEFKPAQDLEKRLLRCEFLRWCKQNPADVSEPLWYAMISNLAAVRPGGVGLCHRFSRPYPGYCRKETESKILQAIDASSPHSCQYIRRLGFELCPGDCPVNTSPVAIIKKGIPKDNGKIKRANISFR
jgi:hypothetical protein